MTIQNVSLKHFYARDQVVMEQVVDERFSPDPVYKCFFNFAIYYEGEPFFCEVLAPHTADGAIHAFSWTRFHIEGGDWQDYKKGHSDWIGLPQGKHLVHLGALIDGVWWQLSPDMPVWAGIPTDYPAIWRPPGDEPPPPPIPPGARIESVERVTGGTRITLFVSDPAQASVWKRLGIFKK